MIFLDILFTILHLVIITFNLFGWIWKKTKRIHLIVVSLTVGSWFILGIWYGLGYCFLTDWHWEIKEKLGETHLPNSFIKYMADKITGQDINSRLVDIVTLCIFVLIVIVTVYVNFLHPRIKRKNYQTGIK